MSKPPHYQHFEWFPTNVLEQQTTVAVDAANRWTGVCVCVFVTNITDNYHFITCLFVCSQKMCLLWSLGASNDSAVKRVSWTNSLAFLKTLITSTSHDGTFEYTHTHMHTPVTWSHTPYIAWYQNSLTKCSIYIPSHTHTHRRQSELYQTVCTVLIITQQLTQVISNLIMFSYKPE